MTQESSTTLDRLDRSILREMVREGRTSHADLSVRVGLSSTACARRIRAMEETGLIQGYTARLDLERLGLGTTVVVWITLDSQSEEALDSFEREVRQCASVVRCFLMSGTHDYLITVLARNVEDFERIHRTELSRLPRVARVQSSFALRDVVDHPIPPAAFGEGGQRRR